MSKGPPRERITIVILKKVLKDGPPALQVTVHSTTPYLPQAPQLLRGPSSVPPGGPPAPHPRRSRSRCDGSAAPCAHTPSTGGILWGCKSTKGCRRAARSHRQQPPSASQALGHPGRGPGRGEPPPSGTKVSSRPIRPHPATRSNALAGRKVNTRSTTSARLLST